MSALRWALLVIAVAAVGCYFVRAAGQRLLYPAPPLAGRDDVALGSRAERIWLESPGARTEAFLLASTAARRAPAPLVLYAHGNGELIDYWVDNSSRCAPRARRCCSSSIRATAARRARRPRPRSQQAMVAAFDWAAARPGVDRARIIGWGRSLGGGAICALARERPLAALVLESTFTSVRAMAPELFRVPGFLVRDPFDNLEVVRAFAGPILLLHGERDQIDPGRARARTPGRGRARRAARAAVRSQRLRSAVGAARRIPAGTVIDQGHSAAPAGKSPRRDGTTQNAWPDGASITT